jgi:2,5-diketo-D-gluconate reductase A
MGVVAVGAGSGGVTVGVVVGTVWVGGTVGVVVATAGTVTVTTGVVTAVGTDTVTGRPGSPSACAAPASPPTASPAKPSTHKTFCRTIVFRRTAERRWRLRRVAGAMAAVPTIELNDGQTIPQLGFGVFQIPPPDTERAVATALEIGYRHIDTAEMYGNEHGVGEALRASGLDRDDVFVTSKLNNGFHRPDDARRAFDGTLAALGFDHVDLFLIHWPLPTLYDGDFVSTWRTLEELHTDGRARSIGVSNFQVAHLERLAAETGTVPAVNQVELHPYFQNRDVAAYGREHGIATEAWAPIAQGQVLDDAALGAIAERHGRSVAQVVLRWHVQRGHIVFPKSVTPERIEENFAIFDFELAPADLDAIDALDRGEAGRNGPSPDEFDYVPS